MLTVEDYARIRRASRDEMSVRAVARTFRHSRRKVREALREPEPRPYTRTKEPPAPKLDAFKARIDEVLTADEQAPKRQRHTASQVFRRLAAEGYTGGYDQVRRYIARKRRCERETFIPLVHEPGQRAEAVARRAAWLRDRTAFASSVEDVATSVPAVDVPFPDCHGALRTVLPRIW